MLTKLTTDQVNYLNIALMVLSALLAFLFPFELFLIAYAVLGPLHYLTEISWLHDRKYFTRGDHDRVILPVLALTVTVILFIGSENDLLATSLGIVGLGTTLLMLLFTNWIHRLAGFIFIIIVALAVANGEIVYALFALFLPSVVHVILFTAAFMLYGALKGRSQSGYISVAVYIICIICLASIFIIHPDSHDYRISTYVRDSYAQFESLHIWLMAVLRLHPADTHPDPFDLSNGAMVVIRLLAFGYTYHYLNWFSKTSVIQWHAIPKTRYVMIIGLWLVSIAMYAYDYNVGLIALFLLSYLHVVLEFPLNHHSMLGIVRELHSIRKERAGMSQPAPVLNRSAKGKE